VNDATGTGIVILLSIKGLAAGCTSVIKPLVHLSRREDGGLRVRLAADFGQPRKDETVMLPKGIVTAYRMSIAYFDVMSRQGPPKAVHLSWSSEASWLIARISLKATASAIERASSYREVMER
jgi:hypothetical protein